MKDRNKEFNLKNLKLTCGLCGSDRIDNRIEEKKFKHGSGDSAPILSAIVPVHKCLNCDFEFLTSEAHMKCHEAVCRHLGVMTPSEIREIRQKLNMTQEKFAELTGIAIASINSWEKGKRIQSNALDNFIYLLGSEAGNQEALRSRWHQSQNVVQLFLPKFSCLDEDESSLMTQASAFAL